MRTPQVVNNHTDVPRHAARARHGTSRHLVDWWMHTRTLHPDSGSTMNDVYGGPTTRNDEISGGVITATNIENFWLIRTFGGNCRSGNFGSAYGRQIKRKVSKKKPLGKI